MPNFKHSFWLLLILLPSLFQSNAQEVRRPDSNNPNDKLVSVLLATAAHGDIKHESTFFRTLLQLANQDPIRPDQFTYSIGLFTEGRAIALASGGLDWVIVVLGTGRFSIPGVEAQKLLLLDRKGELKDQISCEINLRYGTLVTEIFQQPKGDMAQVIIRFVPTFEPGWHNWHTISYEGQSYTFRISGNQDPLEMTRNGLVRLTVPDGRFLVIYPVLNGRKDLGKRMLKFGLFE